LATSSSSAALLRLAGAVLVEAHYEWLVTAERRYPPDVGHQHHGERVGVPG
jgi:hypothetical protein